MLIVSFFFQNGKALPDGPVVISPDGLFPSLFREGFYFFITLVSHFILVSYFSFYAVCILLLYIIGILLSW